MENNFVGYDRNWSNVVGDIADLEGQLDVLNETKNNLEIERKGIVRQYDEADSRKCSGSKPWHPDCWKKEGDKKVYADKLSALDDEISKNDYKIAVLQKKIDTLKGIDTDSTTKYKLGKYIGIATVIVVVGSIGFFLYKRIKK